MQPRLLLTNDIALIQAIRTRHLLNLYIISQHIFSLHFSYIIPIPWLPLPQRKTVTINFLKLESSAQIRRASSSTFYLSNAITANFLSARTISRLMPTSVRNMTRTNITESLPTVCQWNLKCILTHVAFSIRPALQHPSCSSSRSRPECSYGHALGDGVLRCNGQSQVQVNSHLRKRQL